VALLVWPVRPRSILARAQIQAFSIGSKHDKLYRGGSGAGVNYSVILMVGTGTDYDDIYVLLLLENYVLRPRALVKHRNQGILVENSPYLIYKKIL